MAITRDSRAQSKGETHVPITPDYVRTVFKGLENGDGAAFFEHVADDVDWIVMGAHPPSGSLPEQEGIHCGHIRQTRSSPSTGSAAPDGIPDRQRRSSGGRAPFTGHGQERYAVR